MEEIKEGEYIRTLGGTIAKVLRVRTKTSFRANNGHICTSPERYFIDDFKRYSVSKPYVKKHSKDVIDLIEEGDYVNGYKVNNIENGKLIIGDTTQVIEQIVENDEIETVVTKEQFSNMEYKVEEQ